MTIVAQLKKGDRGATTLHDAVATLHCGDAEPATKPFSAAQRLSSINVDGRLEILQKTAASVPFLNLPPGEETQFSTFFKVPHGQPCTIDVTGNNGERLSFLCRNSTRVVAGRSVIHVTRRHVAAKRTTRKCARVDAGQESGCVGS